MKQIVFNSFPRSGNVYSTNCYGAFFDGTCAAVHIPEIFSVKEILNVTLFRKPEDAIASLIYKQAGRQLEESKANVARIETHADLYRSYIYYAEKNNENIYIGAFDDLVNDTVKHFENVASWSGLPLVKHHERNFKNLSFVGQQWSDKYDGHLPREKSDKRLEVEQAVAESKIIQELNQQYETFINTYRTVK